MLTVRRLVDDVDDDGDAVFLLEGNAIGEVSSMGTAQSVTRQRSTVINHIDLFQTTVIATWI